MSERQESRLARLFPPLASVNVPNAVTTLAAVCGFSAIVAAHRGLPRAALSFVLGAIVLDRLDGALARRLKATTELGRELDSLSDALAFGAAPALLAAFGGFDSPPALVVLGLYCLAALWRLAYFNITGLGEGDSFTGVPTTVAASFFVAFEVALLRLEPKEEVATPATFAFFVVAAALMVSGVRFPKNGLVVKSLYLLLPLSAVALWIR